MTENIQRIVAACDEKGRVCPQPMKWNDLWQMLPGRRRTGIHGWEPSQPLILGAWWTTSPGAKNARFKEHLVWAEAKGVLAKVEQFLDTLSEEEWFHGND